jgi:hypothetical protein
MRGWPPGLNASPPRLHVDHMSVLSRVDRQGSDTILAATTRESLGLFRKPEHLLQVVLDGNASAPVAEWTMQRWDRPYVDAHITMDGDTAPDVEIEKPTGGVFVFPSRPNQVTVRGGVFGQGDYRVYIAGQQVMRDRTRPGWGFETTVPLDPGATEIEVRVETEKRSIRWLVLSVVR